MSANNRIIIYKKSGGWFVEDRDEESGGVNQLISKKPTLEMAIKVANEYMKEEIVEYGLRILV